MRQRTGVKIGCLFFRVGDNEENPIMVEAHEHGGIYVEQPMDEDDVEFLIGNLKLLLDGRAAIQ